MKRENKEYNTWVKGSELKEDQLVITDWYIDQELNISEYVVSRVYFNPFMDKLVLDCPFGQDDIEPNEKYLLADEHLNACFTIKWEEES